MENTVAEHDAVVLDSLLEKVIALVENLAKARKE